MDLLLVGLPERLRREVLDPVRTGLLVALLGETDRLRLRAGLPDLLRAGLRDKLRAGLADALRGVTDPARTPSGV